MTRNAELLEKIATRLEQHPDNYDQSTWFYTDLGFAWNHQMAGESIMKITQEDIKEMSPYENCGTRACIAGWAVLMSDLEIVPDRMTDAGAKLLGLTESEATLLFDEEWLPQGITEDELWNNRDELHGEVAKLTAEALRALARGASVLDVTNPEVCTDDFEALALEEGRR